MKSSKLLKKIATIAVTTSLAASMLIGCGGKTSTGSESAGSAASTTGYDASAKLEMWTFVDQHAAFFTKMLGKWNAANPDKKLDINFTVLPYDDMHNKLQSALLSGQGAPDICDVEVGKFPNFLKGEPQLETLDDVYAPYKDKLVKSRVDLYSKGGHVYGFDYHVGAVVAYYNDELLTKAGVDYKTIKTWDDFKAAGEKYYKATGKYMGTADTNGSTTLSLMLAEQGSDYTTADGKPNINSKEMVTALTKIKELQNANAIHTIDGGQPDTDPGKAGINNGDIAAVIKAFWMMSRYTQSVPDGAGKWAISAPPVFSAGDKVVSVGDGGTGTVVTKTAKNKQAVKEFLAWAKLSDEGEKAIWEDLGFDPVNTTLWTDKTVTHNPDNQYVKYFKTNAFDTLNQIKDGIGLIKSVEASPNVGSAMQTVVLPSIFDDNADIKQTLDAAQSQVENELK